MARTAVLIAMVACISVVPAGVTASENVPPLADAGLDQRAEVGETVLLDGTGSRDPGGTIETYEWQIRTPDGTRLTPADPSDPRTRFVVHEPGRYDVTVTVTDGNGARSSDTLYVYVTGGVRFASNAGGLIQSNSQPSRSVSPKEVSPVAWFSSWNIPEGKPYLPPGKGGGDFSSNPADPDDGDGSDGNGNGEDPPGPASNEEGTLNIVGSDLTYKEDVAYDFFGKRKLKGREMGDGQNPLNEVYEGFDGIYRGVKQGIVGVEEKSLSYQVSGEKARELEEMPDYSRGVHEDEISEKLNTRSNAPAVKEDYILNDARVVKPASDTADKVTVNVRVPEKKGVTDYVESALRETVDLTSNHADSAPAIITKGINGAMNTGGS